MFSTISNSCSINKSILLLIVFFFFVFEINWNALRKLLNKSKLKYFIIIYKHSALQHINKSYFVKLRLRESFSLLSSLLIVYISIQTFLYRKKDQHISFISHFLIHEQNSKYKLFEKIHIFSSAHAIIYSISFQAVYYISFSFSLHITGILYADFYQPIPDNEEVHSGPAFWESSFQ